MKKHILIIILTILLLNITVADASAKTVFLTSDNIAGPDTDRAMLNSIKDYVEQISNGKIEVIVDSQAPSPGEGTRAIEATSDVRIVMGACCAGNLYIISKYSANSNSQVIYINAGDFNLDNASNLRRAWDDNYSPNNFAGLNNPGKFLNNSGISYIQPLQKYPDAGPGGYINNNNDDANKYIAEKIVENVNNYDNSSKTIDKSLIVTHKIPVSKMAGGSSQLYSDGGVSEDKTYNGYTAPQLLYLTSSYLNGNGIDNPGNYENPNSPLKYSLFTKDSYSVYQYMEMGGIVKNYMDEHNQAPDFINYEGAYISYDDLQYNFAKITSNHTDLRNMDFEREYSFDKVNDSILVNMLPILIIGVILLLIYLFIRQIRKIRKKYK